VSTSVGTTLNAPIASVDSWTLESQILLDCAAPVPDEQSANRLQELQDEVVDWNLLLRSAESHGLMPLVHHNLKRFCSKFVPPTFLAQLKVEFVRQSKLSLGMVDELKLVLDRLNGKGIAAIPFKGPHLAQKYYGDILLRIFNDLDILVREADVDATQKCLEDIGYTRSDRREVQVENRLLGRGSFRKLCFEAMYEKSASEGMHYIDLHWRVLPPGFLPICETEFHRHVQEEILWEQQISSLDDEMMLMLVILHGCKHGWSQLSMIVDTAQIIRHAEIDWDYIFEFSEKIGAKNMFMSGVFLAHRLLRVDLPNEVVDRINNSIVSKSCNEIIRQFMVDPDAPAWGELEVLRFLIQLKNGWVNRFVFVVQTGIHIMPRTLRRCFSNN